MLESLQKVLTQLEGMWRFRWFVLLVAWPLCLAGWVYVFSIPEVYQARAQVYIDTQSVLKPLLDGLAVRAEVTDRIGMMTRALVSRPTLAEIARTVTTDFDGRPSREQQVMLKELERQIYVGIGERENIYEIRYQDERLDRALNVVKLLLKNLVEDTVRLTRADTSIAQQFLHTQIAEYEVRLTQAERRLAGFKKRHLMPSEGQDYYSSLQEAMKELRDAQAALRLALDRRQQLKRQLQGEEPVFGMVDAPPVTGTNGLDDLIGDRQMELERLKLQFTDQHPDVVALKEVIEQLESRRLDDVREAKTSD